MFCVVAQSLETHLTQQATSRLSHAFAESTRKAYATLFRTFLAFVAFMCWDLQQVNVFNLLCFLECLHYNGVKHSQMANYLSAIKTTFLLYGLDVACFADARIKYYQKSIQLHAPLSVKLKKVIDGANFQVCLSAKFLFLSPHVKFSTSLYLRFFTPQASGQG